MTSQIAPGASIMIILMGGTSLAQTVDDVKEPFPLTFKNLVSQNADADPFDLGVLVLSGERVERTVFDTPSSVIAVSGDTIDDQQETRTLDEALSRIPNVTFTGNGRNLPTIRGVNSTGALSGGPGFVGGARPRATAVIDGRPLTFGEITEGVNSVWDVERIEVFRGPQTTSQGVNSIAGTFNVVTRDPTFSPEGLARLEFGSRDGARASLAVSGPIAQDVAARLSFDYQGRDSFVTTPISPAFSGRDFQLDEFKNTTVRAKFLWEPSQLPGFSTKLTFSYSDSVAPTSEDIVPPFDSLVGLQDNTSWENESTSVIHDISYEFDNGLVLSNRFSYADFDVFNVGTESTVRFAGDQITNETLLSFGNPDAIGVNGVFGLFYEKIDRTDTNDFPGFEGLFKDEQTSLGVFGEATWQITDRFDVTGGLRYQKTSQQRSGDFGGRFIINYDQDFDAVLPKIAFGYDVSDDLRFGAQISRGFNPGGTTVVFSTGEQADFENESVWNYELFMRGRFLDDRLVVNANVFYSDFSNYQAFTFAGIDPITGFDEFKVVNAESARSFGLEIDAAYQATEKLNLQFGLGLLDTEIRQFSGSASAGIEGSEFARAPSLTLALGANYEIRENFRIGASYTLTDSYYSDDENTTALEVGPIHNLDLRASYQYENAEFYAYVTNVFDSDKTLLRSTNSAALQTPRTFGIGVQARF